RHADLEAGRNPGLGKLGAIGDLTDTNGPVGTMQLGIAERMRFELAEERQAVTERPTLVAELAPVIVVGGDSADIDKTVDRARAAHHLAARPIDTPAVQGRLLVGYVFPVHAPVEKSLGKADRNMDPRIAVLWTGFKQQHRMTGIHQPGHHRSSGRASANDNEIEFRHHALIRCAPSMAAPRISFMRATRRRARAATSSTVRPA